MHRGLAFLAVLLSIIPQIDPNAVHIHVHDLVQSGTLLKYAGLLNQGADTGHLPKKDITVPYL